MVKTMALIVMGQPTIAPIPLLKRVCSFLTLNSSQTICQTCRRLSSKLPLRKVFSLKTISKYSLPTSVSISIPFITLKPKLTTWKQAWKLSKQLMSTEKPFWMGYISIVCFRVAKESKLYRYLSKASWTLTSNLRWLTRLWYQKSSLLN